MAGLNTSAVSFDRFCRPVPDSIFLLQETNPTPIRIMTTTIC